MPLPTYADVDRCLEQLPHLAKWLPDTLVVGSGSDNGSGSMGQAAGSTVPINVTATALLDTRERYDWEDGMAWCDPDRQGVLPYLHGWVRDIEACMYDHGAEPEIPPLTPTITNQAAWLRIHLINAYGLPQWPEFADGIRHVHHAVDAATAAVRRTGPRQSSCGTCEAGTLTPSGHNRWTCTSCDKTVTVRAVTLREAAQHTGHPLRTLQHWAKTKGWARVQDNEGRRYYDLAIIAREVAAARLRDSLPKEER